MDSFDLKTLKWTKLDSSLCGLDITKRGGTINFVSKNGF